MKEYVIIGGTTKAATTSLFEYISAHPEVCGSLYKESRFFLDEDYPLDRKIPFGTIEHYNSLFSACLQKKVRLEATPDYLYSSHTPQRIKQLLPDAKLIFVLREPVSRLISWYKFALQNNILSATISFDEFVAMQQKPLPGYTAKQHLMALQQGKYIQYLTPYYEIFDKSKILILFYEDISQNHQTVMKEVCEFIGIDARFYENFNFQVHNKTQKLKSPGFHDMYRSVRRGFRRLIPKTTFLGKWLRGKHKKLEPLYLKMNQESGTTDLTISDTTKNFLYAYYLGQKEAIENLCGKTAKWY